MQSGILKHVVRAAAIAVLLYIAAFWGIEYRRARLGPWELRFGATSSGEAELVVNQARLRIRDVRLVFADQKLASNPMWQVVTFAHPREGAFELPFGRCLYTDLTFLPGVVTCELFGHEVEFMPRTLVVDKQEIAWQTNMVIRITADRTNRTFDIQRRPSGDR